MDCTDCRRPLAVNPKRKSTRCQRCAARAHATSPEKRQRCSQAMKRRFDDPVFRMKQIRSMATGLKRALDADPSIRERMREHGRRVGALHKGNLTRPAGSPERQKAARAQSEFYMGWCPLEYRDGYRRMVRIDGIKAADARRMTEELIEADQARYLATGVLPQARRAAACPADRGALRHG